MDTTSQTTVENSNGFSGSESQEQVTPTPSIEVGGDLAKGDSSSKNLQVVDYTPEQVQAAKDFIWDNMDENNRGWIAYIATLSHAERAKLYIKEIYAAFEGTTKKGVLVEEKLVIRPSSSPKSYPNKAS